MTTIAIDGLNEDEFRRSIERKLRRGQADEAVERLRELIAPFAGPGRILPERFLTIQAGDLVLNGWSALGDSIRRHDRPGRPVTALSIAYGWPGEEVPVPDPEGRLSPLVETAYYTDDAFPFSQSGRDDLLDGYSYHGCTWADDCEASDRALWLDGIDDLNGALAALEARLLASDTPDEEEIRAGSLGACLLSVLLFQAVGERIARDGLPRPLCVMAGSNGVYPYFDAPVAGMPEDARRAAELAEEEAVDAGVPGPRYSSLLVTGIRRAQKRAVLVLEETEEESAVRIARLRGLTHAEPPPVQPQALEPAPRQSDTEIVASPASPLAVKKPGGHAWDFRDLLPPRGPEPNGDDAAPEDPGPGWDEDDAGDPVSPPDDAVPPEPVVDRDAPLEPVEEPLPQAPAPAGEPVAQPGFSLLDSIREERPHFLRSLPLPQYSEAPRSEPQPDPEPAPQPETEPEPAPAFAAMPTDPVWPFGIDWLEQDQAEVSAPARSTEPTKPARRSLWEQLRRWWNGQR